MLYIFISNNLILFLTLFIYFIVRKVSKYKNIKSNKLSLEQLKESPELFLKYLDSFYITNFFYTILCNIIYFSYSILIIFILRIFYIGHHTMIIPLNIAYSLYHITIIFILIMIIIILLKTLLELLFYKEVLKLYLYVKNNDKINTFILYFYRTYDLKDFIGPINLFLFCISTLKEIPTDDDDYQEFYYYKTIYEKPLILRITKSCIYCAKKLYLIHYLFKVSFYICNIIYEHMRYKSFGIYFFYLIFFIIIFYDFIHFKFYYTYYFIFIFFFIHIIFRYFIFIGEKSGFLDKHITQYFYKNDYNYISQRIFILEKNLNYYREMRFKSKQNAKIFSDINSKSSFDKIIDYVYHNLQSSNKFFDEIKEANKRYKEIYFMYFFIFIFLIITLYLILHKKKYVIILTIIQIQMPIIILLIPLIIMLYLAPKIYLLPQNASENHINFYDYNKKYAIFFWFLVLIQSMILLTFFYHTNILALFNDNTLWDHWGIKIYRNYTLYEKQEYFNYLFDVIFSQNYFMYNLEQFQLLSEFKQMILENISTDTTIKNIQDVLHYIYLNTGSEKSFILFKNYDNNVCKVIIPIDYTPWMYCIKNITNILVFWEFFISYLDVYIQIRDPHSKDFLNVVYQCIKALRGY